MTLLDLLERVGEMPAEIWLVPPVLILALMAAIGWLLRTLLLRDYRAIAARTGLTVAPKILNPSEVRAPVIAKMFAGNRELRELLLRSKVDSVELLSAKLHVYHARSERDPEHAELLFTAAARLADAIDGLKPDYTPEIIRAS